MFFNTQETNYDKNIIPFIKNGIIVDTSVLLVFFEGLISVRVSKKTEDSLPEYKVVNWLIQRLKLDWKKFYITPHILTEVCTNIRNDYCKKNWDFTKVFKEIAPFLNDVIQENIENKKILNSVNPDKPILEVGDISIFLKTDDFIKKNKKTAIMAKDFGISNKYKDDKDVLLIDLYSISQSDIN